MQVNPHAVKVDYPSTKPAAAQAAKPGPESFSDLLKGAQASGTAQRDAGAPAANASTNSKA